MRFAFTLDRGSGPERVEVTPAAIVAWERATDSTLMGALRGGMSLTTMIGLAHAQLVLDGRADPADDLDTFTRSLRDVEPAADVTGPGPT